MIGGRIENAKQGKPWSGKKPFGRTYDKETGKWFVNERGKRMRQMLERYANGEGFATLLKEFTEFSDARVVLAFINQSQLSGTYVKEFNIPELNIHDLKVPVPAIPEVISPKLFARVQARMEHRRTWNKENRRSYPLTGFVRCGHCGRPLTGNTTSSRVYYRHCVYHPQDCVFHSIRHEELAEPVLDYLFSFFVDEPAFDAAIKQALPSDDERASTEKERDQAKKNLASIEKQISRLVDAVAQGVDAGLLFKKQNELRTEHESALERLNEVEARLEQMPDRELLQHQMMLIRLQLLEQVKKRDWRKLPNDEIRRLLIFLFGENPGKTGNGITVFREKSRWRMSFKGMVQFHHELSNGRPDLLAVKKLAARHNEWIKRYMQKRGVFTQQT